MVEKEVINSPLFGGNGFRFHFNYFFPKTIGRSIAEDPYEALLLWSVLSNMQKMALFMWERGEKNLARALVAGKVYKLMARLTHCDDAKADVTDELTANFELVLRI